MCHGQPPGSAETAKSRTEPSVPMPKEDLDGRPQEPVQKTRPPSPADPVNNLRPIVLGGDGAFVLPEQEGQNLT